MKESTRVLVALGGAIAIGAAIGASGSAPLLGAADSLAPLGTLWVNAIRMTVIPLVVSLLITGVASAADAKSIGRMGGRTILVFVLLPLAMAALVVPLAMSVLAVMPASVGAPPSLPAGAAEAASQLPAAGHGQTLAAFAISLIPSNPVAAAANGAMVPLLIFTLLLAIAISQTAPPARATLLNFFQALGEAMLTLVRWVVLVAPLGIFALILPLAAHAGAGIVGAMGAYILAYSAASLAFTLLLYPVVTVFARVPIRRFARAVLPAQLIAFSSSSSIASLPALVESAQALGLPQRVSGFVLPLAVSAFKIAAPVSWTVGAMFVAWFYHIPMQLGMLATIAFAAVFLAFAAPGVPRGAFIMLAPLFTAIGLPVEGIGILIAVDAIPDVFATVLNVTGDLAAAAIVARSDGGGAAETDRACTAAAAAGAAGA